MLTSEVKDKIKHLRKMLDEVHCFIDDELSDANTVGLNALERSHLSAISDRLGETRFSMRWLCECETGSTT